MIEVHPNPAKALSDGPQSLTPNQYQVLMQEIEVIGQAVDRGSQKYLSTVRDAARRQDSIVTV